VAIRRQRDTVFSREFRADRDPYFVRFVVMFRAFRGDPTKATTLFRAFRADGDRVFVPFVVYPCDHRFDTTGSSTKLACAGA
jgi:hypothetical protein